MASSIRDFAESPLDLQDEEISDDAVVFNLKYLGHTVMTPKPEESSKKLKFSKKPSLITTSAIKKIINNSKSQKKLKDVTISITPKGIETFDAVTAEPLLEVPIYRISYCSIDAAHETVFAFVSSTSDKEQSSFESASSQQFGSPDSPIGQLESSSLEEDEGLVLHAFQCQKRKIAHTVTMTVARAFERAFQIYQNEQFLEEIRKNKDKKKDKENISMSHNIKSIITDCDMDMGSDVTSDCLIDLGAEDGPQLNSLYSKDRDNYFQTTWVAFE